jgi:hypothetical protein
MKKWEIIALVFFFGLFIILFFSVEQPWQPKTSKVGETVWIEDVGISVDSVSVDDQLAIRFEDLNKNTLGYRDYEAGTGWKFVILDMYIYVIEDANGSRTFSASRVEDENGVTYGDYSLLENLEYYLGGTPYHDISQYCDYINLQPGEGEFITVAYKMSTNAVPEKFHYNIYNSRYWDGVVILKK